MAGTRQRSRQKSLATTSDFCDFQSSGICERLSDEDLNSDIEDAIYAKMFFDATGIPHPSQVEGEEEVPQRVLLELEQTLADMEDSEEDNVLSVSLDMSVSMSVSEEKRPRSKSHSKKSKKGKEKACSASSKIRRKSESKLKNDQSLTDTDDVICLDDEVIDLTTSDPEEPKLGMKTTLPKRSALTGRRIMRLNLNKTAKDLEDRGKESSSARNEHVSSSPEADIKRLFNLKGKPAKPVSSDKYHVSHAEEEVANQSLSTSGRSSSLSGRGSSLESGELSVSGGRSRVGSDEMDLCSEGSGAGIDDPWMINLKDKMGRDAYERLHENNESAGRYYGKRNSKCTNCKQRGHDAKHCPWPKRHTVCYLCAGFDHVSGFCPRKTCAFCYGNHMSRRCTFRRSSLSTSCTRCFMKGHHASICPDQWRQFHHTTYENSSLVTIDGKIQRRTDKVYCSNCSVRGHFGFECVRPVDRPWINPPYHLPLVALYTTTIWPPKDPHSLRIIQQVQLEKSKSRAHERQDNMTPRYVTGNKRPLPNDVESPYEYDDDPERVVEQRHGDTPSDAPSNKKKKNRNRGFNRNKKYSSGASPPRRNHTYPTTSNPSLLATPSPLFATPSSLLDMPPTPESYPREPHPSHDHRRHFEDHQQHSRYGYKGFSSGKPQVPPHRRYSDQIDQRNFTRYPDGAYSQVSTPTTHRGHMMNREGGRVLTSDRGFQMSERSAQQSGIYHDHHSNSSPADRRHSLQGQFRY